MNKIIDISKYILYIDYVIIIYLIFINIITFIVFGLDKYYSIKKKNRISENNLFKLSLIGGTIGGICAMNIFHHKTMKKKFYLGLPIILILQIITIYLIKK